MRRKTKPVTTRKSLLGRQPGFEVLEDRLTPFASPFDVSSLLPPVGNGTAGFVINGINAADNSGYSVKSAGDINRDGYEDIIIGAPYAADGKNSFVIFGKASGYTASLDLASLDGTNGFAINGFTEVFLVGLSVSSAADINGDGFDDLIIGGIRRENFGSEFADDSFVIFGKASGYAASLNLSSLNGTNGFAINGIWLSHHGALDPVYRPMSVSSAGDINGDGFDDLVIGSAQVFLNGQIEAGQSYVIFGKASGYAASLSLYSLDGTNGFAINGDGSGQLGWSVSSAGDVNSDGFDDLIIGAPGTSQSYVIFGKASGYAASLNLSSLNGTNGFVINGAFGQSGWSVSSAGDINADGFDDLLIGAPGAYSNGQYAGRSYVIFGKASGFAASFNISSLSGTNGFAINGINEGDNFGWSVSSAGDINADGFDDLLIGAPGAYSNGQYAGRSYVIFGKASGFAASFNISSLSGTNGFAINGINEGDNFGWSVSSAGDINADGADDLILGAPNADHNGLNNAGQSYVIFGTPSFFPVSGGPYTVAEGQAKTLNGSVTGSGTFTYGWDFNNDGVFTDATGVNPTVDWATLQSFGITDGPGAYNARLRVTNAHGANAISDTFTITVTNAPPVISPGVELRNQTRGSVALKLFIDDAAGDKAANYLEEVDWNNDGIFDEALSVPGNQLAYPFQHTYSTFGTKTVRVRATDKDGGVSAIVTTTFDVQPYVFNPSIYQDTWSWVGSAGDDEVAISLIDNTSFRITETKINGVVVNNVYNITTAAMDLRPTYITAYGNEGNDRIDLSGLTAPLAGTYAYGGTGNDFIIGSVVVDNIFGELGNDTIYGGYGADAINGGDNDDLIYGEMPVTPTLTPALASMGADTIYGGFGNDTIYGDSDGGEGKADTIFGDDGTSGVAGGNDIIYGDGTKGHHLAADTIDGEGGNDTIFGDASGAEGSADSLYGGYGNDLIDTGGGNDYAEGNVGNDILLGGDGGEGAADTLDGGFGPDIIIGDGGVANPKSKVSGSDSLGSGNLTNDYDLVFAGLILPTTSDPIDWMLIQAEWIRNDISTANKLAHLTGQTSGGANGTSLLKLGVNAFDDVAAGGVPVVDIIFSSPAPVPSNTLVFWHQNQDSVNFSPTLIDLALYPRPA